MLKLNVEDVVEALNHIRARIRELQLTLDVVPENGPIAKKFKAEIGMWERHLAYIKQVSEDAVDWHDTAYDPGLPGYEGDRHNLHRAVNAACE